jgi:hypothetical protein
MTEGRRHLLAVLQRIRGRELALRVHVTESAVSHWSSGTFKPSKRARLALEQQAGIAADAWDRPALPMHLRPKIAARL